MINPKIIVKENQFILEKMKNSQEIKLINK